jgi:serine/threonine protein kinase
LAEWIFWPEFLENLARVKGAVFYPGDFIGGRNAFSAHCLIRVMSVPESREKTMFYAALELNDPAQRRLFLNQACAGDAGLLSAVEELLKSQTDAEQFFAEGASSLDLPANELAGATGREKDQGGPAFQEKPGTLLGHYKLLQKIGEGGCGVVYMAEQVKPVRRRVALKVIKLGMDTKSVIARFEAERQALALMDHPNIAKVFDAGATESGRPYFVMELVRGVKITEYCDQNLLTTEERLKLFVQVCQAIQHAHQKGIIHRDIKPSNILVTTSAEGIALPVVIDFGIAKAATNQQLTDKTLFTAFEMLIGTPAYMSPEQATLSSVDVDTRTDIYSLGVLLYELLTGSTPFDAGELLKAGLDEVRRVIQEQEPLPPSTRLSKLTKADLTVVAQRHRSEPPTLIRRVCGDLDWIAMKALEKNRARRYETANGLSLDIQRFLANETVSARPHSALYKLQKTVLRNKLLFSGMGVIAMLLVASLIVVSATLAKERQARRDAEAAKAKAESESAKSQEVTKFLEGMLHGVEPLVARGQDTLMLKEILDQTAERIGRELTNQPAVRAGLMRVIGRVYGQLGDPARAEAMSRGALALYRELPGGVDSEIAGALNDLSIAQTHQSKFEDAEKEAREALAIQSRLPAGENLQLVNIENQLAWALLYRSNFTDSAALFQKALATGKGLGTNQAEVIIDSENGLAFVQRSLGKWSEAESSSRDVLARAKEVLGPDHPKVAIYLANLSFVLIAEQKYAESESALRECVALRRKILKVDHPDFEIAIEMLGYVLAKEKKWTASAEAYREVFEIRRRKYGDQDSRTLYAATLAEQFLMRDSRMAELNRFFKEFPAFYESTVVKDPQYWNARAEFLAEHGQWMEALAAAKKLLELRPSEPTSYHLLAPLLVQTGNRAEYEELCRNIATRFKETTEPSTADQMAKDCLVLPRPGADLTIPAALADLSVTRGLNMETFPFLQACKSLAEYRQGHWSAATDWAQQSAQDPFPYSQAEAYAVLAMAQYQLKQRGDSLATLEKCAAIIETKMPKLKGGNLGQDWRDWIIVHALMAEAKGLIEGAHGTNGSPHEK